MRLRRFAGVVFAAAGAGVLARCPDSNTISGPTATPTPDRTPTATATRAPVASSTPTATPTAPSGGLNLSGTGSATWTSIVTTRPLCPELRNQVGTSYSMRITVRTSGASAIVTLQFPDDEAPGTYAGTIAGDQIRAEYQGPFGGVACPGDSVVTPQTGGGLSARLSADAVDGEYSAVYGSGPDDLTFHFTFHARLAAP